MKTKAITTSFLLFIACIVANAQTVNNVPLTEIDVQYVEIVGMSNMFGNKLIVSLDFGQENNIFNTKEEIIRDENGKVLKLNSMIDALNFMSKNGYEFKAAYVVTVADQNIYHWLLKRE